MIYANPNKKPYDPNRPKNETFYDVKIPRSGKNFSGKKFGSNGTRDFGVILDEENALRLKDLGWKIDGWKDNDGNQVYIIYIRIDDHTIIRTRTNGVVAELTSKEAIGELDNKYIDKVEVTFRAYKSKDEMDHYNAYCNFLGCDIKSDDYNQRWRVSGSDESQERNRYSSERDDENGELPF